MLQRVQDFDAGLALANDSELGLTAGIYGSPDEVTCFLDRIEAGVTYANRAQGATTGAWPGYQPFGGWKNSIYGDLYAQGVDAVAFYTRKKIITERWFGAESPMDGWV